MNNNMCRWIRFCFLTIALTVVITAKQAAAGGTWAPLLNGPPVGVNNCLLLSDGTVLAMNGAGQCCKLTPDSHGSYINGTWTTLATMNSSRLFFASDVLTNGNVFVAGGEYGDANHYDAELFDSRGDTWTVVPGSPAPNFNYSDSPSEMLPNGNLLVSDSQSTYYFYNVASNLMTYGGTCGDMNEVCLAKLPNGAIFGVDNYGNAAEHFVSTTGQWVQDASSTPVGFQGGDDQCYLLPNGQVFHVGSEATTGFYTPGSTAAVAGTLINGPNLPMDATGTNQLVGGESPGAMLVTGNILLDLGPNGGGASGGGPCYFYEYNYLANTFTQVGAPGGGNTYGGSPFVNSMLDLPDGSILFVGGQNSGSLYVYTPAGTPLAAAQPTINGITENQDGTYNLVGKGLNGISEGAEFGDDEQMACNYPLVRLTNNVSGNVYYARTYNWNNTTVQSTNVVTTTLALPPNLPVGIYSLVVSAVGNASVPVLFTNSPPPAPTGLTGTAGNAQASLSWNAVTGATTYNVKRLTTTGTPYYATVATMTGTSYTNVGLVNLYNYFYVVTAVGPQGESTNSLPVSVLPSGPPPVPVGVTATPGYIASIGVSWTPSFGATLYNIKRSTNSGGPFTTAATSANPFFTDSGLVAGLTYYYVISALNADGESSNSAVAGALAEAVADYGFETPAIGSGNYVYHPLNAVWTFSGTNGNGSGLLSNGSGFLNPSAPEGVQAAFVQSNGVISQVLSGFIPGNTYTIAYSAAQRSGGSQNGGESWNVKIDGTVIQSNSPGATSYTDYTASFTATARSHSLSFVGTDLAGGDNTVFIDNVRVGVPVTVANFGFETPTIANYQYNPSGATWTFSGSAGNGSGLLANGSGFSNPNAPQGAQSAFVQEFGTISQTISGFTPGTAYTITYYAAQRSAPNQNGGESWNVLIDNKIIQTNAPGSTSFASYSTTFIATATSHVLKFAGTDHAGGDNTVFIDDVTISAPLQPVAPAITVTSPTNGVSYISPASIALSATVVTNGNVVSNVQFYDAASNLIGQVVSPPYNVAWTPPGSGVYSIFARANCSGGASIDSPTVTINVVNSNMNLSFERPVIGSGNYAYSPTGGSWVFGGASGNGAGLVANGSGFANPNAPQGVQAAFVQGYGAFSQALNGFTPGVTYTIGFSAAQRGSVQNGGESWNVMIDGAVIATFSPGGTNYANYTATFTAWAGTHTLAFVGTDYAFGDNTVFLDNVSISPGISQVPPVIALTSPANNAVFSAANPVTLAATATANGNTIVGVQFYSNATNLITQVTSPYTYAWSNANAGASTVFARLVFNGTNTLDTAMVNITVTNPPPSANGIGLGADGHTLSISGSGLVNRPYYLYAATNLVPPVVWTPIQTNLSDAAGNITFTNLPPTNADGFFRISAP